MNQFGTPKNHMAFIVFHSGVRCLARSGGQQKSGLRQSGMVLACAGFGTGRHHFEAENWKIRLMVWNVFNHSYSFKKDVLDVLKHQIKSNSVLNMFQSLKQKTIPFVFEHVF